MARLPWHWPCHHYSHGWRYEPLGREWEHVCAWAQQQDPKPWVVDKVISCQARALSRARYCMPLVLTAGLKPSETSVSTTRVCRSPGPYLWFVSRIQFLLTILTRPNLRLFPQTIDWSERNPFRTNVHLDLAGPKRNRTKASSMVELPAKE